MSRDTSYFDIFDPECVVPGFSEQSFKQQEWLRLEKTTKRSPSTKSLANLKSYCSFAYGKDEEGLTHYFGFSKDPTHRHPTAKHDEFRRLYQVNPRMVLHQTTSDTPSPVSMVLRAAQDQSDLIHLGKLVQQLSELCVEPVARAALQRWLTTEADSWIQERRPALSAVIEVGARLALQETITVVASVLQDDLADLTVASVAAQRIRWLKTDDAQLSVQLGRALSRRIDDWLQNEETRYHALRAMPSAPRLLWKTDRAWLERHIAAADDQGTWALVQGIIDIAGTPKISIDKDAADSLFKVAFSRLEPFLSHSSAIEDHLEPDLAATLIWALGAVCTEGTIEATAALFVRTFDNPRGLRAAASVRAGRLVVQHWGALGMQALIAAFGAVQSTSLARYLALVSNGR